VPNAGLQEHASSQEHCAGHDTGRVTLTNSDGSIRAGALCSHRGRGGLARRGGSGQGHSPGGRSGSGQRRRGHGSRVLGCTLSSLLASLLAVGVIGVSVDALAEGGLTDIEGDGLDVLAGVGSGSVSARALELQSAL